MDADKRHQLKQNELAEALARLRDFSNNPQTTYWVVGLAILVALYAGYRLWGRWQVNQVTSGWAELGQVSSRLNQDDIGPALDDLQSLIANATDPVLAGYARIRLGTVLRDQAHQQPERREELLDESIAALKQVVEDPLVPAPLVATAAFSLGTSYESRKMLDEAAAAYQQLAEEERFAGSPFKVRASARLENMDELRVLIHFEPGMSPPQEPPTTSPVKLERIPPPTTSPVKLERIPPPTTAPASAVDANVPAVVEPAGEGASAEPTTPPAAAPSAEDPPADPGEPAARPPTTQPTPSRTGNQSP